MSQLESLRQTIAGLTYADEEGAVKALIPLADLSRDQNAAVGREAAVWLADIRKRYESAGAIEKIIHHFRLTDTEGLAMMTLAEALPRIPDDPTADLLISEKLAQGDWKTYLQNYPDFISKLAWIGLMMGKELSAPSEKRGAFDQLKASGLREAMRAAMKKLGGHFVLGETIESALHASRKKHPAMERYSFDMLGESARTAEDAARYFEAYKHAIKIVGDAPDAGSAARGPVISVKLSALHPRFEWAQHERFLAEAGPKVIELVEMAATRHVGLTIDAEEAERLEVTLPLIEKILALPALKNYNGFGIAVQAYQKRAPAVLNWLHELAEQNDVRITVRLVKGAYWDKEIKLAQERGMPGYPVFTRKEATDISYLACARMLLAMRGRVFPQFGTHNLHTVLAIKEMAGDARDYEIQRLHGMGAELHALAMDHGIPSCVYAPVGPHKDLLSYLIRRLVENSANSSFVTRLYDKDVDADKLAEDPVARWQAFEQKTNPVIAHPAWLFGEARINSSGMDLNAPAETQKITAALTDKVNYPHQAAPMIEGVKMPEDVAGDIKNPANFHHRVGVCYEAGADDVDKAMQKLHGGFAAWNATPFMERAGLLDRLALRLEAERESLIALLVFEAGKTWGDAVGEVREATDMCRYYAASARRLFGANHSQKGITGEHNELFLHGRGVFVCISPWNFPLAIMLGQVAAALVTGNTALIKPAEQTLLIAARVADLMLGCGIPSTAIALMPGNGVTGSAAVNHPLTAGVVFTGSGATAKSIQRALAAKDGPIVPLIAETGGINALIADSSALPEMLVDDVIQSAFRSAGQRCSAARLLCLSESIADHVIGMLAGATRELQIGSPADLATDVGPVIDQAAFDALHAHELRLKQEAKLVAIGKPHDGMRQGYFILPQAWEIPNVAWLNKEVFGPILHIVRYKPQELPQLIEEINALGFGLTGGFHSRIESQINYVRKHLRVGNLYINRSIIGAVVESQPFGGEGASGTGPKAGGPLYLLRFIAERSISTNTTASGGNIELLSLR